MAAFDITRLRNQTLADGQDSEVTVNTRALIDKVLARYSSEHTTLRELIQNASDAGATTVKVKFETDPSQTIPVPQGSDESIFLKHVIQHHTLKRLTVSNNGVPFTAADWNRLKSIADGNPDETKIGAFGVGFYSVFSDCDDPFVVSGDRTMAFYWKGNTLSTKMSTIPPEHASPNTTFSLDYRQANRASPSFNPSKIPNLPNLCQFLATSLTFVGLETIELHLDDFKVASFTKKISPPSDIRVPQGLKTDTEGGLLRVTNVTRQHSQIEAEWSNVIASAQNPPKRAAEIVHAEVKSAGSALKSFFSRFNAPTPQVQTKASKPLPIQQISATSEDISGDSKGIIFLQVCTVEVETRVTRSFSAEIERATKKPPPRHTRIQLLTSSYHEPSTFLSLGTGNTANLASKIFKEVLPTTAGRIFIGFPTAQTTPFLAHVSAPSLIPTVERENVDMNARYISTWNTELLRVAGLACRISYTLDMADLRDKATKEPISALIPQAAYICKQYTANVSHPSTVLGEKMEEAFFNCSKERSIAVLSTNGVKSSQYVRMPAETLSFLGDVPMVPQDLATEAVTFFVSLHNRGYISELTMTDIRNGLDSRALSEEELTDFLKWCGSKAGNELDPPSIRNLFDVAVANIGVAPQGNSGRILSLSSITSYVNTARINPALPIPPDTMPFAFTKEIPVKQLQMFGWTELSMVRWLQYLTTAPHLQELTTSEHLATQVLTLAAKTWDQLDNSSKEAVVKTLTPHAVIPTKMGLRRPGESYFPNVKLFEDLPTVKHFPGAKEKFLQALGVRKTVELSTVFARMKNQDPNQASEKSSWNHADLIRYFASVIDEIPKKDLESLRQTPFLPGEGATVRQGQLFKAGDLYAPDQGILSLGLAQVKLPFEYRANSKEGNLLLRLGLKQFPPSAIIANILHRAGLSNDRQLWTLAMEYFIQNYAKNGYAAEYHQMAAITDPILPVEQAPFPNLVAPFQCYTNERAACLGYAILRSDLRPHADKFGIRQDPDIQGCVQRVLASPPKDKLEAEQQFTYLAARSSDLDQHKSLIPQISATKIVPVFKKYYLDPSCMGFEDRTKRQTGKTEARLHHHDPPETVFVGRDQAFKGILDYVQYSPEATAFLLKVGAKHEPSSLDLALLLSQNASRFLNTLGQDRYLDLLRKLSEHADTIWKDKDLVKKLVASRVMLGYRDVKEDMKKPAADEEDLDDLEEKDVHREWSLNKADEIIIIDDVHYMAKFRDFVIAAPQEEQLEEFYAKFGAKKISELVKAEKRIGVQTRDQAPAQSLLKDILERTRLFLHAYERDDSTKSIRHDAKWLSSHLAVQCVSDISIRYSLADRNVASSSKRTAAIVKYRGDALTLNITPKYDPYDVADELVKILIRRPKQNDAIALERILAESLKRLQAKGINVERILRQNERQARIAQQQELEREQEEQQRLQEQQKRIADQPKPDLPKEEPPAYEDSHHPKTGTPEKSNNMPGAFGSPENNVELAKKNHSHEDNSVFGYAKKLFKNTQARTGSGPEIGKDIQTTKTNIANAIKDCRPTNSQSIVGPRHQDPTELDRGGYCNGQEYENISKAFTIPFNGRHVEIFFGRNETSTPKDIQPVLHSFIPLIFRLTSIFGVDPAAVNIFLDKQSNTVAFNHGGSLFFNLAWFMSLHAGTYGTVEGRQTAWDSWFLTYCHELAHNLVQDHNARHNWYNQQMAIEFSPKFRAALNEDVRALGGRH